MCLSIMYVFHFSKEPKFCTVILLAFFFISHFQNFQKKMYTE